MKQITTAKLHRGAGHLAFMSAAVETPDINRTSPPIGIPYVPYITPLWGVLVMVHEGESLNMKTVTLQDTLILNSPIAAQFFQASPKNTSASWSEWQQQSVSEAPHELRSIFGCFRKLGSFLLVSLS